MIRPRKCFMAIFAAFLAFAVLISASPWAEAGPLYDWSKADVRKFADPEGDTQKYGRPYIPCFDIVAAYQAFDGTFTYFRIDLASSPSLSSLPENLRSFFYDARYGIYIDSALDGAPETNYYVPQIQRIGRRDNRIDVILETKLGNWHKRYRQWNGTDFTSTENVTFQRTDATLEWKFQGDFGADFRWHAAVMLPNQPHAKKTFDYAGAPIPGVTRLPGSGKVIPAGQR